MVLVTGVIESGDQLVTNRTSYPRGRESTTFRSAIVTHLDKSRVEGRDCDFIEAVVVRTLRRSCVLRVE